MLAEEARLKQYLHEGSSREPLLTEVLHELVAVPLEPLMAKETGAELLFKNRNPDGAARHFDACLLGFLFLWGFSFPSKELCDTSRVDSFIDFSSSSSLSICWHEVAVFRQI